MSRRKRTTRRKKQTTNFPEKLGGVGEVAAVVTPPETPVVVTPPETPVVVTPPETATPTATAPTASPEESMTVVEEAAVGAAAGAAAGAGAGAAAGAGAGAGAGAAAGTTEQTIEDARAVYIYLNPEGMTNQISTQANDDPAYTEIGIIHVTDSAAINAARGFVTDVSNLFGAKGFDNTIFDLARNGALNQMKMLMTDTQKVCNLRMETSNDPALVFVHMYGTLLEKK